MNRKRIAIYGGTFDPVHLGHLEVARKVCELFDIDELLFVPATVAPHKLANEVTPAIHRHAMLVLATQDERRFYVSTFEIEAANRRYTVDTLAHFAAQAGEAEELFFLMGADSWSEITTWREWERLLGMVNHIVVTRPGYDIDPQVLPAQLRERVVDLRGTREQSKLISEHEGKGIFITNIVMRDVSSTDIRRAVKDNKLDQLNELVSPAVEQYIKKYDLYRESNETEFNG